MKQHLKFFTLFVICMIPRFDSLPSGSNVSAADSPQRPTIVRHAGGAVDGQTYTNSIKAIESSISGASFLIEIDLLPTRDGDWYCYHDYRELWPKDSNLARFDATLIWWLAKLPHWTYPNIAIYPSAQELQERINDTPHAGKQVHCTLSDLRSMSAHYPQATFITDTKYDNYALMDQLRTIDSPSIVPQVYNIKEYEYAKSAGFKRIVYTLYKRGDFRPLQNILRDSELWKIVFPAPWLCNESPASPPTWINQFGGQILVHTINHPDELCRSAVRVDGYYSDFMLQSQPPNF